MIQDPILMAGDEPGRGDGLDEIETGVVTRTRPRTKKPSNYKVLMLNDDYTPMEFVVLVLERFFSMGLEDATPVLVQVYQQGVAVKDLEERKRIYTEIAIILNDELPWIPLWSPNSLYAVSNRLQGFAPPSYIDNKFWNAETWSVTE